MTYTVELRYIDPLHDMRVFFDGNGIKPEEFHLHLIILIWRFVWNSAIEIRQRCLQRLLEHGPNAPIRKEPADAG